MRSASGSPRMDAYLPLDRQWALAEGRAMAEQAWGAVLSADLSGFTALMDHLSDTLGPQQGAEELTHLLNALFAPLIGEVHRHGGTIVAFGGDALTCWFPESQRGEEGGSARRAASCALAMQQHVAGFGPVETPAGPVRFAMHVGIASGLVRRFCVGRPPHGRHDVLAGSTVDRMAVAQGLAGTGQVVADTATAGHLPGGTWQPLEDEFALLTGAAIPFPAMHEAMLLRPAALPSAQVRRWLAEPLYRRLRAGRGGFAAELRLVSSLFVQFDGLDYDHDPQVGRKLQRYVALAQERLAPYEGYLGLVACGDKGSLLLILFGAPLAHEDDPQRAVGFALDFQEAVKALPWIRSQRIGGSLGRVYAGILGSPERCTYTVLGDEVNVSARLMQAAGPGQVLVSPRLRQGAAERHTFHAAGTVVLKGKNEPLPAFEPRVLQARPLAAEAGERLVGREPEQQRITALLDEVAGGRGQLLLLLGQAGVGKSALVRFLQRQAHERGWPCLVGNCLSYGQSTPYLPWRAILEQAWELRPEAPPQERAAWLQQVVAALPAPAGRSAYWQERLPLLAAVMGLEVPDTPLTRSLEGELRRENTFQLLEALVRSLATERPAVIVIEDAYWGDELSLLLAAHVGRSLPDLPLLLTIVHRPFVGTLPPAVLALQALPRHTTLSLAPLEQGPSRELARQRLQGADLPPRLEALLAERAQGNPFYIEELLRALDEAGYLRRRDGGVELSAAGEMIDLPDTIEGVVRARLDRLPEEERLTLKVAAVIGRAFRRPLVHAVHPARPADALLGRQLARLERADFTQLEQGPPEWRYIFQHPIVHEVTYETLLFAQRRQLHGAIGAVLEQWYAGDLPGVLDLLAHHYARSEEREKAVHYLQRAADKARRDYANEVALRYYNEALERLLPQERPLRFELLAGRERIHDLLGERDAQAQDLQEMGRLAEELADARRQIAVLNRQARRAADIGELEEGRAICQQALERAVVTGDLAGQAEAYKTLGVLQTNLGEYEEARTAFERGLEAYRVLGDHEGESISLNNLGLLCHYRGGYGEAGRFYQQALEMARQQANRRWEGLVLGNLGLTYRCLGDYERARSHSEQAMAIFQEIADLPRVGITLDNLGAVAMAQGDMAAASSYYQRALELARRLQDPEGEATSLANLGLLHTYAGEHARARVSLRAALRQFGAIGHRRGQADTLHLLGVLEQQAGRARAARRLLERALSLWQEIGDDSSALVTRAWLGSACLDAGDPAQARACLAQVAVRLEAAGYGGAYPEQEVWWAAWRVWQATGDPDRASQALEHAHHLVQEQAGRIADLELRRSFLERIPVNREVERAWGGD